jgi:transcriptional regulator GlxA family with amidase domain
MLAADGWAERFAVLDTALLPFTRAERALPAEVARAWQLLLATGGTMAVSELSDEIGWSSQHLSERFRAEIGLSPKEAARVLRFDRARRTLQRPAADRVQFPA